MLKKMGGNRRAKRHLPNRANRPHPEDSGLVHIWPCSKSQILHLFNYQDNTFKLFSLDIGLLAAPSFWDAEIPFERNHILTEFKGTPTEQCVLQKLIDTILKTIQSYTRKSEKTRQNWILRCNTGKMLCQVKWKVDENLKTKSLKVYGKQTVCTQRGITLSMADCCDQDWMVNIHYML